MRAPRPSCFAPCLFLAGLSAAGATSAGAVEAQGQVQAPAPPAAVIDAPPPLCPTACDNPQMIKAAVDAAIRMNRARKPREAVEYLEGCQRQCPAYECALVHLVRSARDFYDRREYQLKLWNYAKACTVQPPVPYERGKDRQLVEADLKQLEQSAELQRYLQDVAKSARLRKVGLGLLIGGIALGVVGVSLAIAGETSYLPAAGSCPSPEGLSGDPCVLDYHGRTVYLPVLGAGIGLGITGALFMQKYKEKAPKSFWEAP